MRVATAVADWLAALTFSLPIKVNSLMSRALGLAPARAIWPRRVPITWLDATSISVVLSARSAHSVNGSKKAGRRAFEGISVFLRQGFWGCGPRSWLLGAGLFLRARASIATY